jgi:hypothetical protein
MFLRTENGVDYIAASPGGPWRLRVRVTESRQPGRRKTMPKRSSTPAPVFDEHDIAEMMSHFPHLEAAARRRKAQLGERPRRRVREQAEAVPLSFEDGAIDNLCDQLKAFLKRGAGQGGRELTYAEADDYLPHRLVRPGPSVGRLLPGRRAALGAR